MPINALQPCRALVDAHRQSLRLGGEYTPHAVPVLKEEDVRGTLSPYRFDTKTTSSVQAGPSEPDNPNLRRWIWRKPFFDQLAQAVLSGLHRIPFSHRSRRFSAYKSRVRVNLHSVNADSPRLASSEPALIGVPDEYRNVAVPFGVNHALGS
ncbi:hypothetical protein BN2476_110134 [Paraburkholderia piptadeniae]|uniref:Uncharacterized protein n=1 Tax=Paraburkholderia piptadeniae TaxID=1701573 RepID=A0A1N7RQ27_9BURK|nr:hypothetical protein [Paraburkholderia piptadeniae]SIT37159.1 hypothetical protein BN2476_110134 [Paraburkholderia piptadeniae]